jgi:uncharacterized protein YjbI with pentapeptide repeats
MANQEQLEILKQGVEVWNKWREENFEIEIDLSGIVLLETNLSEANLSHANLSNSYLRESGLGKTDLSYANLKNTDFTRAYLQETILKSANLRGAILREAHLEGADFREADLRETDIIQANLSGANLTGADLRGADLFMSILSGGKSEYGDAFPEANFSASNLEGIVLAKHNLTNINFSKANLVRADLSEANLDGANLNGANLSGANLYVADLYRTDLRAASLTSANLVGANLIRTNIDKAKVSGSSIYSINVWDLEGEFEEQRDLIITRRGEPIITVDNIKIAQFVYLILNNEEIRNAINTLTSKSVLILGRFSLPERKAILDALRNKLREYDLLPIVFDFDRPTDKDFTETIKTLAGLSYFVIADVTNPKSSPLELQATVPDYQIPFVPIIQEGENPFAMMVDLQKKYNWVLNTVTYDSMETLIKVLKPLIIEPAMKKRNELRLIKAQVPEVISGKDFLGKEKE